MGFIKNSTYGKKWILVSLVAVLVLGTAAWGVNLDHAAVSVADSDTIRVEGLTIPGADGYTLNVNFDWDWNTLGFILSGDNFGFTDGPMNVYMPADKLISTSYKFFHNSSSPDGKKMFLAVNRSDVPFGNINTGLFDLYMLDAAELEKGNVVVLAQNTVGAPGTSGIMFRSTWSKDGTTIALAGASRLWIIDAGSLQPLNGPTGNEAIGGENHDAMFTTDGKYVIMTLRTHYPAPNDTKWDGELQLYDVAANATVGGTVSVCNSCHADQRSAVLCGIDGVVAPNGDGTYSGTVFVAGHGGHFAKANVTIDPSQDPPITHDATMANFGTAYLSVSQSKFTAGGGIGTSQYKLHDVRLDGDPATGTLYWSTYNLDENSMVHYGTFDVATKSVKDHTLPPFADSPEGIVGPAVAPNAMPFYCASGQTATAHIPVTMSYPAYFTVIPKGSE